MFKVSVRDEVANKLQLAITLLGLIKEGKTVNPDLANKALNDIDKIMVWLDEREKG